MNRMDAGGEAPADGAGATGPIEDGAAAPVCGARVRRGGWCRRSPAPGFTRCRQHGGHARIGAPKGSRNNWKHGLFEQMEIEGRQALNAFYRKLSAYLREREGR